MRRRDLLRAVPLLAASPVLSGAATGPRRLMVVFASGGWDSTYCLDPKLGVVGIEGPEVDSDPGDPQDVEVVETFDGIPIVTNPVRRPAVATFFGNWARYAAVVNGIWVGNIAHAPCRQRMLTGRASGVVPDVSVIAGSVLGGDATPLGSVDASGLGYAGDLAATTGRVGRQSQLALLLDPSSSFPPPFGWDANYPGFLPTFDDEAAATAFLRRRAEVAEGLRGGGHAMARMADYGESLNRLERLVPMAAEIVRELSLGADPSFATTAGLAMTLFELDVARSVLLDSNLPWDTHASNVLQHGYYDSLFGGLNELMASLDERNLLETTTVVVMSEMNRTLRRNRSLGKDHWPWASALILDKRLNGGRVLGSTNDLMEGNAIDLASGVEDVLGIPLGYDNFAAGLLDFLGVDPEPWLEGVPVWRGLSS